MFTPIHLLSRYNPAAAAKYERRWESPEGQPLRSKVLQMIRDGAGEDFLQWEFEQGRLGFLESMYDLKGLQIFKEDITFPPDNTFEAIDFSYASFYHSKLRNAVFMSTLNFCRIYNCEFVDCVFVFNSFYGTTLERVKFIKCEFRERNGFTNCVMADVEFVDCFIPENIFIDCKFDENTRVLNLVEKPPKVTGGSFVLDKKHLAQIFGGIKDAYAAGSVFRQSRTYFFRQMQAATRYNSEGFLQKLWSYVIEYAAGYGVKPFRVLATMGVTFLLSLAMFSQKLSLPDALMLTAGAFFTFGAYSDLLRVLPLTLKFWYVVTSFAGISLTALFITVLANMWLRER